MKDEYTISEIDKLDIKIFDDLEKALGFIKKNSGQLYTQVDSGSDYPDVLYSKGNRFVNRTGIYAVVKK